MTAQPDSEIPLRESVARFITSDVDVLIDSQDGETGYRMREENEPDREPRSGSDEYKHEQVCRPEELDQAVNVNIAVERFVAETNNQLRKGTQADYCAAFRAFAEFVDLEKFTRRQLRGPKGNALLKDFVLKNIPKRSQRWYVAALKSVWTRAIDKGFPLDTRQDLGKLPPIQRRTSPPNEIVKEWKRALDNERDAYLRLIWLLIAQHGWRPSHVSRLKWSNVRLDAAGRPTEIIADGHTEGFKTAAPIAAALTKQVVDALLEWRAIYPGEVAPEKLILPRRLANGEYLEPKKIDGKRSPKRSENLMEMITPELLRHWRRLQEKWGLPKLRPSSLRHWCATISRKADLSKPATAYLMGHDSSSGGAMRDWYDLPEVAEALDEQRMRLPEGPLGYLDPNLVMVDDVPPSALVLLKDYLGKKIGTLDLVNSLENIRLKTVDQQENMNA